MVALKCTKEMYAASMFNTLADYFFDDQRSMALFWTQCHCFAVNLDTFRFRCKTYKHADDSGNDKPLSNKRAASSILMLSLISARQIML